MIPCQWGMRRLKPAPAKYLVQAETYNYPNLLLPFPVVHPIIVLITAQKYGQEKKEHPEGKERSLQEKYIKN